MTFETPLDHLIAAAEAAQGIVEKKAPLRNPDKERRRKLRAQARRAKGNVEPMSGSSKEQTRRSFGGYRKNFTSAHGSFCSA